MALILASASPRRRELLEQIGLDFVVRPSAVEEDNTLPVPPAELVVLQARAKALDIAGQAKPDDVVIGADTIVVVDGVVYGKPTDAADAQAMLTSLAGRSHQVITGLAVVAGTVVHTRHVVTTVYFADLTPEQIAAYVATGEPLDKAGAYGIQGRGALLVERIDGCYANVVGLPLQVVADVLRQVGVKVL